MLGTKWDHKLHLWIVYEKKTGKILKRCSTEEDAKKLMNKLNGEKSN